MKRYLVSLVIGSVIVLAILVWMGLDPTSARCLAQKAPGCIGARDGWYKCTRARMYCCRYGFDCHWVK